MITPKDSHSRVLAPHLAPDDKTPRQSCLADCTADHPVGVGVGGRDLSDAGVCVSLIAQQLGISQPKASRHLETLRQAGLIDTERVAQWNFHHRDETGIRRLRGLLRDI